LRFISDVSCVFVCTRTTATTTTEVSLPAAAALGNYTAVID